MRVMERDAVAAALPWPALMQAVRRAFAEGCEAPLRHRHAAGNTALLLMPAWDARCTGAKIVHVAAGNAARGLPAVHAAYLLSDAATGAPIALLDGGELTDRRTAATSVLAATLLARPASRRLLLLGSGKVAAALADCYASAFDLAEVAVWSRAPANAVRLAARLTEHGLPACAAASPDPRGFDIVSAATLATEPLVHGAALDPGTHLDLVGAFRPHMREADAEAMRRARLFVDTRAGALAEAGDVLQAIAEGAVTEAHIVADLAQLCRGEVPGRTRNEELTCFKSVGWAGEDLAAAKLACGIETVRAGR